MGPNDESLGPRFPDLHAAYDPVLRRRAREEAHAAAGYDLREGTYAAMIGPSYETPAEIRMLRAIGADAVGMSTVHEVIAAAHCGMRVLGISCITNRAAGLGEGRLGHDEVLAVSARFQPRNQRFWSAWCAGWARCRARRAMARHRSDAAARLPAMRSATMAWPSAVQC